MTKMIAGAVAVVTFCLTVGCAHTEAKPAAGDTKGAVRLDQTIRDQCGDKSGDAFFAYDSMSLSSSASERLDSLATCFTTGPLKDRSLNVVGYTDPTGGTMYNKDLGKARADNVAMYLQQKGVPATRLNVSSRGEEGASPDPANWPADRMVDVTLVP